MPKYEVWYTTAAPDEPYDTLEPNRFYCLASYDTYEEAEDHARDDDDFQCQLWSSGVNVDKYGQPLFIDYYQIRDENGKEIDDA
tara:strand:- start:335 stop:586 length:252 start_codon:yes stop_codon:yes gene_type:complete